MIEFFTLTSIIGVFYAYFGYPLLLRSLSPVDYRERQPAIPWPKQDTVRKITIIIAARNESAAIRNKINQTLALQKPASLDSEIEVIVASDASDDDTDSIVQEFSGQGVLLSRSPERKGKEFAQALAASRATGDVIVFTDAKVQLAPDALIKFLPYFDDLTVGAVSSVDRVESDDGKASGEGLYVRYEMWLRSVESKFGSVVGLSGSCFAVRRGLCKTMRSDIPSDFSLLLESQARALRGVSGSDVICTYRAVRSEEEEFGRKVRTVLRGITALMACPEVMDVSRYGAFAWQVISHKLMRWLVPWFVLIATIGSLILADESLFFLLAANCSVLFFALAFVGYVMPEFREVRWIKVPLFFTVTNLAIAIAWTKYFRGVRAVTWQPSAKPIEQSVAA